MFSTILTSPWLRVIPIILGMGILAFGLGWASGAKSVSKTYAQEMTRAVEAAKKVQADKAAKDWAVAQADYEKRLKEAAKVDTVTKTIYRDRKVLVQNPCRSKVPAATMKRLNEIGETK